MQSLGDIIQNQQIDSRGQGQKVDIKEKICESILLHTGLTVMVDQVRSIQERYFLRIDPAYKEVIFLSREKIIQDIKNLGETITLS